MAQPNMFGVTEFDQDPATAVELMRLKRQQQIADSMYGQSQQPLQGGMVGQVYVPPSITQGLAKLMQGYVSGKSSEGVQEGYKALASNKAQLMSDEVAKLARLKPGSPEQAIFTDDYTAVPKEDQVKAAVPPASQQQITAALLESKLPDFKKAGLALMLQEGKQVEKFGHTPVIENGPDGKPRAYVYGDLGTKKDLGQVSPRDKLEFVNGQAVNPYTATTTGAVVPPQANPYKDLVIPGADGAIVQNTPLIGAKKAIAKEGATNVKVNSYTPASEEAQKKFMDKTAADWDALKTAPVTLQNIETAKGLVKQAGGFVGNFGENKLEIVKFFNNNLGTNIAPTEVASAEELRSRLFFQIMDNLKKMDSQPSQQQQQVMRESLGSLTTDPNAIPRVLDAFGDAIKGKVAIHNKTVRDAEVKGVKFPFNPVVDIGNAPKQVVREVQLKDGRIGVEYSDGTRGFK